MVEINELGASKNIHHNQKSIPSSQNLMLILLSMTNWCFNIRLFLSSWVGEQRVTPSHPWVHYSQSLLSTVCIVMKISEDNPGARDGGKFSRSLIMGPCRGVMSWLNAPHLPCALPPLTTCSCPRCLTLVHLSPGHNCHSTHCLMSALVPALHSDCHPRPFK